MLWYKAWLETRWRFMIGLVLLTCSAVVVVWTYPFVVSKLAGTFDPDSLNIPGSLGDQIREGLALSREYRGYVWWQWFHQSLPQSWIVIAVLIGTGGLLSQTSGGAALFTLSMPASRARLVGTRAALGIGEIALLAIVPAVVISLLSPAIGQRFSTMDALIHAICLFVVGGMFFCLAFLLSTVFSDVWRPAIIGIAAYYVLSFVEQVSGGLGRMSALSWMTAESYFRAGQIPWLGLLISVAASGVMLYGARLNIERRDF
jgi:ABC-2 type transport system permease protein